MADEPWKYYQQQAAKPPEPEKGTLQSIREGVSETSHNVLSGVAQGAVLDPIEGVGQLVEHMTGTRLAPQFIRDKLKSFRSGVESSTAGELGRVGGTVGSFLYGGGELSALARGATKAGQAASRAGPLGYSAVREALQTPGQMGTKAVSRALKDPNAAAAKPWTRIEDYVQPKAPPLRPSRAAAALREAPADTGLVSKGAALAQRWPGTSATLGGMAAAAAQPVEGGGTKDFATTKAVQMGLGALPAALAGTPWARSTLAYLASHGAVVVPAAVAEEIGRSMGVPHEAMYLAGAAGGWPLWRMMQRAHHSLAPPIERQLRRFTRRPGVPSATGAEIGGGVGRLQNDQENTNDANP